MADREPMTTYRPGSWVALSTRDTWLLVDLPPDHVIVRTCWSLISTGASVDAVLDLLVGGGLANTPDFALVRLSADGQRIVTRGNANAAVLLAEGEPLSIRAPRSASWADQLIEQPVKVVELVTGEAGVTDVQLPLSAGVTMAAAVRIDPDAVTGADIAPAVPTAEPPHPKPHSPEPAAPPERSPSPTSIPASAEPVAPTAEPSVRPAPAPTAAEPAPSYDHLFGATQRPAEPLATDPSVTAGWHTVYPPQSVVATEPDVTPAVEPSGLIEAVPSFGGDPVSARNDSAAEPAADDPSMTVDRSRVRRELAESGVPTVLAGYCPAGHLSPPHAAVCRICAAAMPSQPGFEIPRPALGVLRLSTGDVVTLDRGVLLGRAPQSDGTGEDRPHVVRLASPENDISRNHAEIVLDGWYVYVRDLGSVNGTEVTLPGQHPVRLRENELQLLESGARITLADEITLTFEVVA